MSMPIIESSTVIRCQAITDIIQSAALQQTALSHILNAEGEKLQAIIGMPDMTADTMLEANKSVQNMVESITRLEMLLQAKLSLFGDALELDCPPATRTPTA